MQIQSGFEPMTPIAHMKNKKIKELRGIELQISGLGIASGWGLKLYYGIPLPSSEYIPKYNPKL